ncbi:hypothetical protein NL676_020668 [Syzygium grande]|nr:hypothetical protein NL676_020668 [Syzygium grande]
MGPRSRHALLRCVCTRFRARTLATRPASTRPRDELPAILEESMLRTLPVEVGGDGEGQGGLEAGGGTEAR